MGDLSDLANLDYASRINRVIDHVTRHLDEPLKLEELSKLAAFSPFHFHRIFRTQVGETLHDFVKRTRLERALYLLSHTKRSMTDIALELGFASSSDFSRSFKAHFGTPPRRFDLQKWREDGRAKLTKVPLAKHDDGFSVRLRELPARRVAYVRVFRPFEPGRVEKAASQMVAWARKRKLERQQWLGYQWEEPELVPLEKCRYDVGLEIAEDVVLDEPVSETRFPAMTVAELKFSGSLEKEIRAFEWLYGEWLPKSGRVPAHQPAFEAWDGLPFEHGNEHFELRVQLAVVKSPTATPARRSRAAARSAAR
ncbi:MAG: AraC family transcriptional regulator [Archangium sp.]